MRWLWLMNLAGGTMVAVLAAQSGASRPSTANSAPSTGRCTATTRPAPAIRR